MPGPAVGGRPNYDHDIEGNEADKGTLQLMLEIVGASARGALANGCVFRGEITREAGRNLWLAINE